MTDLNNNENIPRWTPNADDYDTSQSAHQGKKKKKNKLLVPLIIALAVIVAGAGVGTAVLLKNNNSKNAKTDLGTATITTTDPASKTNASSSSSSGYILTDVSGVVDDVIPAVVSITSRQLVESGGYGDYWSYFFGGFGGNSNPFSSEGQTEEVESGIGSGTIIAKNNEELLILTSYHVVEGCSSLYVTFINDTNIDGYVKSKSEEDDIAIVAVALSNIDEDTLSQIKIATLSTSEAKVGEGVIVIGNALGYGMSVTTGIISATNRTITADNRTITVLQTDAAINSGNSGGCMLNARGEVIGISEAKIVVSTVEGMCYAIPISLNSELIQNLLNEETEETTGDGIKTGAYLGIRGADVDEETAAAYGYPQGVYVKSVVPGSGAEAAGIQSGDIIVGIDNTTTITMSELQAKLAQHNPGDEVEIILMRSTNGRYTQCKFAVTLTEAIS